MINKQHKNVSPNIIKKILDYCITQKKFEQETGDYLRTKTSSPNLYSNDLRHQYASAYTAKQLGQVPAYILGGLNELFGYGTQKDTAIDTYNNKVGRQYAKKYPNYTKQEYLNALFNDNYKIKQQRIKELGF